MSGTRPDGPAEPGALFAAHADAAWRLALLLVGRADLAEDAVQEAFMRILKRRERLAPGRDPRPYIARAVRSAATDLVRAEARRRRREEAAPAKPREGAPPEQAERREAAAAVAVALASLDADERAAVALRCREGFGLREVGEALAVPTSTADLLVRRGLDNLRKRLTAAGFGALALPAVEAALGAWGPASAPASLVGKLAVLATAVKPAAVAGGVAKGGLIVKIGLGVAAVGLAAGATFYAVTGGKSEEPAKPVEPPKSAFATPITDPNAEWEFEGLWSGGGYDGSHHGMVDGPRKGSRSATMAGPRIFSEDGGENVFRKYDEKLDRFFTVGGCGAPGDIAGTVPLSRARLGGWGYAAGAMKSGSSKYMYLRLNTGGATSLKRIDWEKRVMESFLTVTPGTCICAYEGGVLLIGGGVIKKMSDDGKLIAETKVEKAGGDCFEYDPKHNRLYGFTREGSFASPKGDGYGWLLWYWDLDNGGKFVGLISGANHPDNQPVRRPMVTGPFKGSKFWCPFGLWWGPDDPECRYLYMGGGDEGSFYRLDLEKQYWVKLKPKGVDIWADAGAGMPKVKRFQFGDSTGLMQISAQSSGWAKNGDFFTGYRNQCFWWKRVQ